MKQWRREKDTPKETNNERNNNNNDRRQRSITVVDLFEGWVHPRKKRWLSKPISRWNEKVERPMDDQIVLSDKDEFVGLTGSTLSIGKKIDTSIDDHRCNQPEFQNIR